MLFYRAWWYIIPQIAPNSVTIYPIFVYYCVKSFSDDGPLNYPQVNTVDTRTSQMYI